VEKRDSRRPEHSPFLTAQNNHSLGTMSRDPLVVGHVVGDILDPFIKSASLKVLYSNKELTNGCELKPSQVANEPRIEIAGRDMRNLYTLVSL
jgi:protein FLOWERING LOCUS T